MNINTDELNIFYFYVGQADSMLITMNGYTMLIDSGNSSDGQKIVDFIKAQGITKIDYLIGTHIDEDHIGGIPTVIQELDVGIIYMPYNEYSKECYDNIVAVAGDKITSIEASSETTYSLGNSSWKVMSVDNSSPSIQNDVAINNTSIVIQLEYGSKKYLFMGDVTTTVEDSIEWEEVDVLKVAHHGSNSSTSQEFLEKIKPTYAIISSGSSYSKFPNMELLERLNEYVEEVYITEIDGTIWLTSDGNEIIITKLDYNLDGANSEIVETLSKESILNDSLYLCLTF